LPMNSGPGAAMDWFEITEEDWLDNFELLDQEKPKLWLPNQTRH